MPIKIEITGDTMEHVVKDLSTLLVSAFPILPTSAGVAGRIVEAPGRIAEGDVGGQTIPMSEAKATIAPKEEPKRRGRKPAAEITGRGNISENPEDRQPPEETAETQAQDAADEKAEVEANKKPDKPLTHDDIRQALGVYMKRFGMAAAQEDGPKVIGMALGDKSKVKVSDIPNEPEALAKVLSGVNEMLEKNPFKREVEL